MVLPLFFASCSQHPTVDFQSVPPNPQAPLAFFGEGNADGTMKREYAVALQNAGLYNFVTETISEEQIENAVEIRLNYEEFKKLNRVPILVLNAEFLVEGVTTLKFTIKEENPKTLFTPISKKKEKKISRKVLLERFLMEVKRITPEDKIEACKG